MKDFYDRIDYTFEDIQSLIDNDVEESIYLDFKDSKALDKSDGKRKDISKDVASFANSDGGIIIYGIIEENHKASKISFVNGNDYTKEWLEQIINSSIQRRISDLLVLPIRNMGKIEETIYIVKIPKSLDAPHLSKDKKFYKRFNFECVPMEEYEIRQSYGQKLKSKLKINGWTFRKVESDNSHEYKFVCEIQIINEGDVIEKDYKVNVYLENFKYLTLSWPQNKTHYDYTKLEGRTKISANSICPIYPDEAIDAFRFEVKVEKVNIKKAFKDVLIEIKLFYSDGEDNLKTSMKDMTKNFEFEENEKYDSYEDLN